MVRTRQTARRGVIPTSEAGNRVIIRKKKTGAEGEADIPSYEPGTKPEFTNLVWDDTAQAWTDEVPSEFAISLDQCKDLLDYAFIRRLQPTGGPSDLHSIVIQSPYLRELLDKVFEGYQGVSTKLKNLSFASPFHEFFFRWDAFQKEVFAVQHGSDDVAKSHASLLEEVLRTELKPHLEMRDDLLANGLVKYNYLWSLFPPDTEIYYVSDDQPRLLKVQSTKYATNNNSIFFELTCKFVDFDGTMFGYNTKIVSLREFEGVQSILDLEAYPIDLAPKRHEIRDKLQRRGRIFESLKGCHYRNYDGFVETLENRRDGTGKHEVNGRVIVDANMFSKLNSSYKANLQPLKVLNLKKLESYESGFEDPDFDMIDDEDARPDDHLASLTEAQCALCSPYVWGFCLTSKLWVELSVSNVRDLEWNEAAFDRLILPEDYKEMLLAVVETELMGKTGFDDIVAGKGRGIIILLNGSPGTGKTLTAEAVAEKMKRPLYSLSAGQIGYDGNTMENNLKRILGLATKWKAVLLIDECDIFMEKRTLSQLERNKLVSIFLRHLEYFKGVLFLTTNRVAAFDEAFKSRVHLTIEYPDLSEETRLQIWSTFVEQAGKSWTRGAAFTRDHLKRLAAMDLNGREIKNIIKTAQLMAIKKDEPLVLDHVKSVLRVSGRKHLLESRN